MKSQVCIFVLIILVSCTTPKKEAAVKDSTQVTPDLYSQRIPYVPEPPGIFPDYSDQAFTEDEREATFTQELVALLKQYDSGKYLTIRSNYSTSYKEEVDFEEFMDASETKTKTWFYDSLNQLRCFSMEYEYHVGSAGYSNATVIYLFSNDALIAAYDDEEEAVQMASKSYTRLLTGHSPSYGVFVSAAMTDTYQLSELDSTFLERTKTTFYRYSNPDFSWLKEWEVKKKDGNYIALQEEKEHGTTYTIEYTIDPYLYKKFIKSNIP